MEKEGENCEKGKSRLGKWKELMKKNRFRANWTKRIALCINSEGAPRAEKWKKFALSKDSKMHNTMVAIRSKGTMVSIQKGISLWRMVEERLTKREGGLQRSVEQDDYSNTSASGVGWKAVSRHGAVDGKKRRSGKERKVWAARTVCQWEDLGAQKNGGEEKKGMGTHYWDWWKGRKEGKRGKP